MWTSFGKRLGESRIALLSSVGIYVKSAQEPFDVEAERGRPQWGDPTWRAIPADARPEDLGVAHLHINDEDVLADPEIALPIHGLEAIATATAQHVTVMGYQKRDLEDWHRTTAHEIVGFLREQETDGLILAPA